MGVSDTTEKDWEEHYNEALCIRKGCEWKENTSFEICTKCEDHKAGVCLMPEAYQQGVEDTLNDEFRLRDAYDKGREDSIRDTELFREIFLENLVNRFCTDFEEKEDVRQICRQSWEEWLKEKKNG